MVTDGSDEEGKVQLRVDLTTHLQLVLEPTVLLPRLTWSSEQNRTGEEGGGCINPRCYLISFHFIALFLCVLFLPRVTLNPLSS